MEEFFAPENYERFVEGPADGSSNYPADYMAGLVPKDRRPVAFWAVDLDDVTVVKCSTVQDAVKVARALFREYPESVVELREVRLTEADYRLADAVRLERLWLEQIYKP